MNEINVFRLLQSHGYSDSEAKEMVAALAENPELSTKQDISDLKMITQMDISDLRSDLKEAIGQIHVKMEQLKTDVVDKINQQTWRYIGSIALLLTLLKFIEWVKP